ncbi:MAG: hypothetical protein HYS74_01425 [Parcubacteria group bacterium]|nr:hypothetical protein [Parcubacteria group bacterium]
MRFMMRFFGLAILAIPIVFFQSPAGAFTCGEQDTMDSVLRAAEMKPLAWGMVDEGVLIDIYTSPAGRFTLAVRDPSSGTLCPMTAGEGWREMTAAEAAEYLGKAAPNGTRLYAAVAEAGVGPSPATVVLTVADGLWKVVLHMRTGMAFPLFAGTVWEFVAPEADDGVKRI